jgi:membrane protease YdiL (CAAX protease family)
MSEPPPADQPEPSSPKTALRGRAALFQRHRWLPFVLPLVVYMLAGSLEPTPETEGGAALGLSIPYAQYPLVYTLKIALTAAAIFFVMPGFRAFPKGVTLLAILIGIVGVVLWVWLCQLKIEEEYLLPALQAVHLQWLLPAGTRSAFDPLEQLADHPAWAWGFLAIRFIGLVVLVPIIEEFFYRGFLMRFVVQPCWWNVPPGKVNAAAVVLATLVPMAMHPGELLAAAVWFSMITWLYVRTRSIWDCVAAHAVTNLLLGIYVVRSGQWHLM